MACTVIRAFVSNRRRKKLTYIWGGIVNKLLSLFFTIACASLISTPWTTGDVSAQQKGHSPIYHFDVMHNEAVAGQVKVNTAQKRPTYTLVVDGLTPNTNYMFGYKSTASDVLWVLGASETKDTGALRMHARLSDKSLRDLWGAQFWVAETGVGDAEPYWDNQEINSVRLEQDGWFIARLQFYYSVDGGQTWLWSKQTDNLLLYDTIEVWFADGWVPDNALIRVHVEVLAGKDRTDSRVFTAKYSLSPWGWDNYQPTYNISGTTGNPKLEYYGTLVWDNY